MIVRKLPVAFLVLVSLVPAPGLAQNRQPKIQWERVSGEGSVAAYQNGSLLMSLKGERWVGTLLPASKVSVAGYAVVAVTEKKAVDPAAMAKEKDSIVQSLRQERQNQLLRAWLTEVKKLYREKEVEFRSIG